MNIVGFGDSFISKNHDLQGYLNRVGRHFKTDNVKWHGFPGTCSWDAFFQFKDYPDPVDVAVFAWSEPSRLFHRVVRGICPGSASQPIDKNDPNREVWEAANLYYKYIYDYQKIEYEAMAFYQWFDTWSTRFSNTKFIHMWSFAKNKSEYNDPWRQYRESTQDLEYHHTWKNGVEIRPALMYLSMKEGWPKDNDLSKETRVNHLTATYHIMLATRIIEAIEHYKPGTIIQ